jgi:site-specific recombinase XerD
MVARSVEQYCYVARSFLADRGTIDGDLQGLTGAGVASFVIAACSRGRSLKLLAPALRSFLRFAHVEGLIDFSLAHAVPPQARWRLAELPQTLNTEEVGRLLASCDRRTARGRRDYAILVLLSRLGLRRAEVVALRLDDIDWHAGEVIIHGKGPKQERLPLPVDVGEALAAYLRRGRPRVAERSVFIRSRAPLEALGVGAVSYILHDACARAGVCRVGTHVLRHSCATEMLRAGASLPEIGQVLRHHWLSTTAIYAKVDHGALSLVARPWPGGAA